VMMAAGLRATAKAVEHPPEPKVGAPVLDPNVEDPRALANAAGSCVRKMADLRLLEIWNAAATRRHVVNPLKADAGARSEPTMDTTSRP
jgi:hypothetical protein